eukprot:CAMPEP_0171554490 /NCGR_PEP_ID=MMETSP0960-20121227/9562_1 /TAXON_ID=87120 /ORGANISM="Aurantiochytrium limacinum, Strain ATCCMYA-1381" /LENGTH=86 /DNA_ID=CAMNT_0012104369 /DNA_START=1 /DNA_END=262 /DNA_ORIENTATION=-
MVTGAPISVTAVTIAGAVYRPVSCVDAAGDQPLALQKQTSSPRESWPGEKPLKPEALTWASYSMCVCAAKALATHARELVLMEVGN